MYIQCLREESRGSVEAVSGESDCDLAVSMLHKQTVNVTRIIRCISQPAWLSAQVWQTTHHDLHLTSN